MIVRSNRVFRRVVPTSCDQLALTSGRRAHIVAEGGGDIWRSGAGKKRMWEGPADPDPRNIRLADRCRAVIIFRGIRGEEGGRKPAWRGRQALLRGAQNRIPDPYLTIKLNPPMWRRSCAKKYFTSCLYVSAVTLTPNPIFPIGSLVGIRC